MRSRGVKMWQNLYQGFSELSKAEQLKLFKAIKILLFPEEQRDIVMIIDDIRESRFSEGLGCLHCGCTTVKRTVNIEEGNVIFVKIAAKRSMISRIHLSQELDIQGSG